ncbi:MAG: hypothetical protein IKQ16_04830 [Lentisphaeria bacterium]|jgi:hypothetical protein|nr:hypothetical protein [Lentisphaeria bacterium]
MNARFLVLGLSAAAAMFLAACESNNTVIYDPSTTKTGLRQVGNVSSEEMREVTLAAVQGAMTNPKFTSFLKKYRQEMGDDDAIPVLKLDKTINDTDDPDLNTSEITDMLFEELLNSGKVDVTMAEGAGRTQAIAASRDLEYDENFDQSTVAKRGTLQAARLVLRPKVTSNSVRDGGTQAVTRTFVLEMADVQTGLVMWKFTKQLAFMKKKSSVGW